MDAIPPALRRTSSLTRLQLHGNQLSGCVPKRLGIVPLSDLDALGLPFLKVLWLGNNQLSGPIPPELGRLFFLQDLSLNHNQLSGPIPPESACRARESGVSVSSVQ